MAPLPSSGLSGLTVSAAARVWAGWGRPLLPVTRFPTQQGSIPGGSQRNKQKPKTHKLNK